MAKKKPIKHGKIKKGRKTSAKKARKRSSKNNRAKKTLRKSKPQKQVVFKLVSKSEKVQRKSGSGKTVKRTIKKRSGKTGGVLEVAKRQRGKEILDFTFAGVRKVDKKIDVFKNQSKKSIQAQLKRKDGKPPKGVIVTVYDKKGREHTKLSPPDFVVNENSAEKFVTNMLEEMRDDYMEWVEMEGEPSDDVDDNPYKDYNPDTIHNIVMKFIY